MTNDEKRQAWLNGLKAGDMVVCTFGRDGRELLPVEKVTPTQIVLARGKRFRKVGGRSVAPPSSFDTRARIEEATPETTAAIRKAALVSRVERVRWDALSLQALEAVAALLPQELRQAPPTTADE